MAPYQLPPFMRNPNADGTISAICTTCFRSVGRVKEERQLQALESAHVCEVTPLVLQMRKQKSGNLPNA